MMYYQCQLSLVLLRKNCNLLVIITSQYMHRAANNKLIFSQGSKYRGAPTAPWDYSLQNMG